MTAVRGFARYLAGIDPRTEVPPPGLIRIPRTWRPPFIYTDDDVLALMDAARRSIREPLRAATYETLVGLLATTGLRIGEALRLDRDDIDDGDGVLLIRRSKFGKSRQVPLQASALEALARYQHRRRQLYPHPKTDALFVSLHGTRVIYECVWPTFRRLCDQARIGDGAPDAPTLHDFRHSFAVRTLLDWYRAGVDVQSPAGVAVDLSRPRRTPLHLRLPVGRARAARARRPAPRRRPGGPAMTLIAPTLQAFFTDRLARQLQASPRTIASYRDTLRLLLGYVHDTTGKQPSSLDWDDLDEPLIARFLEHLEHDRHNSPRTRNLRLTAIRSLFKYAALRHPEHAAVIQRVLAIPPKRFEKRTVTYLTSHEAAALIDAPDRQPLGRPPRPRHAHTRRSRRPARLRADRPGLRRRRARHRRARPLPRQGTKATRRPAHHRRPSRPRQPGSASAPAVPRTRCFRPAPAAASAATPSSSASAPTPRPPPPLRRR